MASCGSKESNVPSLPELRRRYKRAGLLCSALLVWADFPFLYWGVAVGSTPITAVGFAVLIAACGLAVFFG